MRFYGRWGGQAGFRPIVVEAEIDDRTFYELRRIVIRLSEAKRSATLARYGKEMPKRSGRPRGRNGLTVCDLDAKELGPRLIALARELALDKAAAQTAQPRGTQSPRALPQLRVVDDLADENGDADHEPSPEELLSEDEARVDEWLKWRADELDNEWANARSEALTEARRAALRRSGRGREDRKTGPRTRRRSSSRGRRR